MRNEERHDLYFSPKIIRAIEGGRDWRGIMHIQRGKRTCIWIAGLIGKPEGKVQLGRPRHGWQVILKWVLKK